MVVPIATAKPRDDIDSVDAVVILRELALRMRRADRGRAHEHGGEPRISCWRHLAVLPLTLYHAAKQCHERRIDFVRCWGSEFLRDLTATFNQLAPPWTIVRIIVDGIEDRSGLEQLGSGGYVERV
jgi:hypothetical protein